MEIWFLKHNKYYHKKEILVMIDINNNSQQHLQLLLFNALML